MINEHIKEFINDHKDLIERNQWEDIYSVADPDLTASETGQLSMVLLDAGIDPFIYMNEIPSFAFYTTKIGSYSIPKNVKCISDYAFNLCSELHHIDLSQVVKIEPYAFQGCSQLEEISIPVSVMSIGDCAFQTYELKDIKYEGTMEQWKEVHLGFDVFRARGDSYKIIHCIDGDVVYE